MEQSQESLVDNDEKWPGIITRAFKVSVITVYLMLCPVHLFLLGTTIVFDTACLVRDDRSITNCTQRVILRRPQPLVIACYVTTIFNCAVVMTTLYMKPDGVVFCGFRLALKRLWKKGSFWSLNFLYLVECLDFIILTCYQMNAINIALTVTLVIFCSVRLLVTFFANFVHPVKYPANGERNFHSVSLFLGYWLTLIMFLCDTVHALLALTLDVVEKVTPYGGVASGSHNYRTVANLVLLGVKVTYEARLFNFFWNKLFHGNKDLFSTAAILKGIGHDDDEE